MCFNYDFFIAARKKKSVFQVFDSKREARKAFEGRRSGEARKIYGVLIKRGE
jgi:hypothetical protein